MNVIKTTIEGVLIIEPRIFNDPRGYFFESFSQREFEDGEDIRFAVTENPEGMDTQTTSEIKGIVVAAHQAYMTAVNSKF